MRYLLAALIFSVCSPAIADCRTTYALEKGSILHGDQADMNYQKCVQEENADLLKEIERGNSSAQFSSRKMQEQIDQLTSSIVTLQQIVLGLNNEVESLRNEVDALKRAKSEK